MQAGQSCIACSKARRCTSLPCIAPELTQSQCLPCTTLNVSCRHVLLPGHLCSPLCKLAWSDCYKVSMHDVLYMHRQQACITLEFCPAAPKRKTQTATGSLNRAGRVSAPAQEPQQAQQPQQASTAAKAAPQEGPAMPAAIQASAAMPANTAASVATLDRTAPAAAHDGAPAPASVASSGLSIPSTPSVEQARQAVTAALGGSSKAATFSAVLSGQSKATASGAVQTSVSGPAGPGIARPATATLTGMKFVELGLSHGRPCMAKTTAARRLPHLKCTFLGL